MWRVFSLPQWKMKKNLKEYTSCSFIKHSFYHSSAKLTRDGRSFPWMEKVHPDLASSYFEITLIYGSSIYSRFRLFNESENELEN